MTTSANLYSLSVREPRSLLFAAMFIIGNILLPQVCHLVPQGGLILLPIYFFTLVGAYKYGWQVGLLTALLSPIVNSLLFGMPPTTALPAITVKSVLLALAAGFTASRYKKVSIPLLLAVVLFYQVVGSGIESLMNGSLADGFQDFRIGIPGMLLQVVGGYFFVKYVTTK